MGMAIGLAASVEAIMWQFPSKTAPGSITRQGVCISPVTTPLGCISTFPFAWIVPSNRPAITT